MTSQIEQQMKYTNCPISQEVKQALKSDLPVHKSI